MPNRRLVLNRETLNVLESDELASIAGAAAISEPNPLCVLTRTGSVQYSQCPTCGIACTANCPTRDCS